MLISVTFIGILKSLLMVFFLITALLLTLVVLLQEPKGGGLAAAFGGAGAETFGVQSGSVNKFTTYVATLLMVLAILYAMIRPAGDDDTTITDQAPGISAPAEPGEGDGDGGGGSGGGGDG